MKAGERQVGPWTLGSRKTSTLVVMENPANTKSVKDHGGECVPLQGVNPSHKSNSLMTSTRTSHLNKEPIILPLQKIFPDLRNPPNTERPASHR